MKHTILGLIIASSAVFSFNAHAEIPNEFYTLGINTCVRLPVESQQSDGVVEVVDAVSCKSLYSMSDLLEVVVRNDKVEKEIYVYDQFETYEFERNIKVGFTDHRKVFDYRDGAAMYLGKTQDGRDRFIIHLKSILRTNPSGVVDIYVKMGDRQYQTTSVKIKR